jgi:hypothetical protein
MMSRSKRCHGACLPLVALLASCAALPDRSGFITVASQPANVGDAKVAARGYHDSGAYDRDLAIVAEKAASWITQRAPSASRPALILDIDETALSNWEIIKLDDFGRRESSPRKPPKFCTAPSASPSAWKRSIPTRFRFVVVQNKAGFS